MKNVNESKKSENSSSFLSVVSLVLGLTCVVIAALFVVYRFLNDRRYEQKWKEYDECGLA